MRLIGASGVCYTTANATSALAGVACFSDVSNCTAPWTTVANVIADVLDFRFRAVVDSPADAPALELALDFDGADVGWAAVGFHAGALSSNKMADLDVVQVRDDAASTLEDRFATGYATPSAQATAESVLVSRSSVGGRSSVVWRRALTTAAVNDGHDVYLGAVDGVGVAFAACSNTLRTCSSFNVQHTHTRALDDTIKLVSAPSANGSSTNAIDVASSGDGGVSPNVVRRRAHASLMAVSWLVAAPVGAFIARYGKPLGHVWFLAHRSISSVAIVASIVGLVLSFLNVQALAAGHLATPHAVVGALVTLLAVVQGVLGSVADRLWTKARTRTPVFPDQLHWWLGRLLLAAGGVNVVLGVNLYRGGFLVDAPMIAFMCLFAGAVIAYAAAGVCLSTGHGDEDAATAAAAAAAARTPVLVCVGLGVAAAALSLVLTIALI